MPKYEFADCEDKSLWDAFVTSHKEANFLQSFDFYEFHKSRGNEIVRRIVKTGGKIVAAYAGVVEHAKRGRHLAIAGGPILDWKNQTLVKAVFADIRAAGERNSCVFVRVRPQLELSERSLKLFENTLGLKKAPIYLSVEFAGILNLEKSEEEILAGMRQRLRRALRKAEKNHIVVEKSTDPKDIKTFYNIQLQTAKRHDFFAFSEDFLTKQFAAFAPNGEAVLYTAKYDGEILAQNFMIFYGNEASYHYGVSSELGTKLSGAPLLHMEAMRDARARGIGRYNFWGIVGEDETSHRFYGVSCFKRGFGVEELKYVPAHDLILKPLSYRKTWAIETARRKFRHV
ncbi:peptidoglycan bridge formation glycyltransferase FemA/FemB family protein [Candidatus Saccharibacteria bacterium]|nr:peptidoglycan bridge formation glycyltransferase FemA/FemB family protein [Candidatus Saccharibacteria bacterium]